MLVKVILKVLGSQLALGVVGLLTFPVIARGLGPDNYGEFSIFLLLCGVVYVLDVARTIAVKMLAKPDDQLATSYAEGVTLVVFNAVFVSALAGLAGLAILDLYVALILVLIAAINCLAGFPYALLAARGAIAHVTLIRNLSLSAAFTCSALAAVLDSSVLGLTLFFLVAHIIVFILLFVKSKIDIDLIRAAGLVAIGAERFSEVKKLIVFNMSGGVLTTTDKSVLKRLDENGGFGVYAAHSDLALKLNMISNAVGSACYPEFSRLANEGRRGRLDFLFLKILLLGIALFFAISSALIIYSSEIISLVLGTEYIETTTFFSFFVFGVFLNFTSFIVVPYQRSLADFSTSKNAYLFSALIVALSAVPLIFYWGFFGALVCYFIPRLVDVVLLFITLRNIDSQSGLKKLVVSIFFISICSLSIMLWN